MKRFEKVIFKTAIVLAVSLTTLLAADVELVGTIEDGLYSPTSLEVTAEGIAVLEPYSSEIKLYTPEGLISQQINLVGEAHALTSIGQSDYLYCDRGNKKIIRVNISTGESTDFLSATNLVSDPVDLLFYGSNVCVLDADMSAILTFDLSGIFVSQVSLLDENQQQHKFASSFDYSPSLNRFYLLEQTSSSVFVYDDQGQLEFKFGSFGNQTGEITRGGEIAVDRFNRVFISDRFQGRVVSYDESGKFLTNIGGNEGLPSMNIPTGLDIDEEGLIYVSSTMSAKILIFYSSVFATAQTVAVQQLAPEDAAILTGSNVQLIGLAEPSDPEMTISGLEFELYINIDSQTDEYDLVATHISEVTPQAGSSAGVTADWQLTDELTPGAAYRWHTRAVWEGDPTEWTTWRTFAISELPSTFTLGQNYPNPFNPATTINFSLADASDTKLEIFNLLGKRIIVLIDEPMEAGDHETIWTGIDSQGNRVATGIYFYRLISGDQKQTRKMLLLK